MNKNGDKRLRKSFDHRNRNRRNNYRRIVATACARIAGKEILILFNLKVHKDKAPTKLYRKKNARERDTLPKWVRVEIDRHLDTVGA